MIFYSGSSWEIFLNRFSECGGEEFSVCGIFGISGGFWEGVEDFSWKILNLHSVFVNIEMLRGIFKFRSGLGVWRNFIEGLKIAQSSSSQISINFQLLQDLKSQWEEIDWSFILMWLNEAQVIIEVHIEKDLKRFLSISSEQPLKSQSLLKLQSFLYFKQIRWV